MLVSIQQPEFLPWLPFFDKVDQADVFVLLDNVQFEAFYFQNRCKVRDGNGAFSLMTMPVRKSPQETLILEKEIDAENKLIPKTLRNLERLYAKAPFYKAYGAEIAGMFTSFRLLADLNIALIRYCIEKFGITTRIEVASKLPAELRKGGNFVIFDICKACGATDYLSGRFGKDYLDEPYFRENGVAIRYHDYAFAPYPQPLEKEFVGTLSALDLLFNCGDASLEHIRKGRIQP